uniref:Ycf1 protein n=1 Tax=Withania frutescens TaxID=367782 RepID=UPI00226CFEDC|nr:Ycf1 protein [Withania frutescens]UZP15819.1 Ycf1 protein [Withania frutescens]
MPKKWRTRVNQSCMVQNKNRNLNKWNSYEKDQLIHYKKENDSELYSLSNQKDNFKKCYSYDLLSYKSINYENKSDSFISRLSFQVNKNFEISYNSNTSKHNFFDMPVNLHINNYLRKGNSLDIKRKFDRKYFDWKIIHFSVRQKGDIEAWVKIDTNSNPNTKIGINNYQIIDKIDKKGLFYLTTHQNPEKTQKNSKKVFFDWMGMNEKIFNRPILDMEFWFFPEFVLLYNVYKIKPWIIPSKLLLLNLTTNENVSQNKNQKQNLFLPSNKKIKNRIEEAKEPASQGKRERGSDIENKGNLVPVFSKHQNDLEKDYAESDTNKKTKQYKRNTEAELDLFLKRYLLFQLRWNDALNQRMLENIKVYCLLLRLINPTKITMSSIQRREMRLDIMLIQANLTLTELMKKGVFIIEPIRLSVKNNGQFIMYQTIGISLVHKSKNQTNQRYREQRYVDQKNFDEFILQPQNQRINTDKNHFDLLVPENILWSRRRRELRIRSFFNSLNWTGVDRNSVFCNETNVKNWSQFLDERKPLYKEKNELIKFKFFIWPNYRLEDLACMNRYWFDTNNGSRFSILRIHMYPQLKIN